MKRLLIALFALCSFFAHSQTLETPTGWNATSYYFRPDAQNPKRIPKSFLAGNYAKVVSSSYTTKGEADVAVGGGSTLTITLGQTTEAVQGKSILIYDYTGNRTTGNYIRVQSHSPSTVKIDGEDYYDINTTGGWIDVYFDGSNYKVRDSNRNLDGDVLLVQNGTIRSYKTIQLANAAAVAGGTIVLLKDLTLTAGLALTSGVSVDGNGKTITIGGSGDLDLFWVQSGISKIYNFKRIESTRTGSAARWLFACFGTDSKMYVDVDEIKVLDGCVALAGNNGSTLNINARKIDLGTYNTSAGLNARKFFSNNGASIKVTDASITDSKVISTAYGFVASVLYGGQELAEPGDTLRSVMEFENVEFDVSRPLAIVERMGELRLKNIKAKTLAKTAISVAGDPYTTNASQMRHYNKVILTDCEILGGTETQGVYFTSLISVTSDNSQGFDTNFQDIYCFGTNYINTNTTNSFYNSAPRYGIKNYGTIIYNGPILGETFIYNQPIPLGATLVGGGSITSVGLSMPAAFNVTGSPITTSGTFGVTGAGSTAQYIRGDATLSTFATDVATAGNALYVQLAGSYANPTWITSLPWSKLTSTPTTVAGYSIVDAVSTGGSYSNPSWITSLAASKISSILSIAQGGTGAGTQAAALTALLPSQAGNSGKVLQTDGTNATWQTAGGGGGISGSGTTNKYIKWASSSSATDAIVSDDGSKVTVTGGADAMLVTSTGSGVTQQVEQTSNNDVLSRFKRNGGNFWDLRYYYTGEAFKLRYNDPDKFTFNTDGSANFTGGLTIGAALGIGYGGTGQTTANAALNAFLPTQTSNSNKFLKTDATNTSWATAVTSVDLALPSIFTVTGNPITTSGTITGTLASQTANTIFAAPSGSSGAPTFRAMAVTDLPNYASATGTYSGTITWDGSAPSGGTSHTYTYIQIGKLVVGNIRLEYASSGATNTNVTIALTGLPAPFIASGVGSGETGIVITGGLATSPTSNLVASRSWFQESSGTYVIKIVAASNGYSFASASFMYTAN